MSKTKELKDKQREEFIQVLKVRFEKNKQRHKAINWSDVQKKLEKSSEKISTLHEMEATGGEPDVVGYDTKLDQFLFMDCSAESPIGRRSLCYDAEALATRKENKPKGSAEKMAQTMGVEILTEAQYRELQELGDFDQKTSSWVKTPPDVRKLGGAIFCDRRYERVFVYHNGAESYYAARGFRALLRV